MRDAKRNAAHSQHVWTSETQPPARDTKSVLIEECSGGRTRKLGFVCICSSNCSFLRWVFLYYPLKDAVQHSNLPLTGLPERHAVTNVWNENGQNQTANCHKTRWGAIFILNNAANIVHRSPPPDKHAKVSAKPRCEAKHLQLYGHSGPLPVMSCLCWFLVRFGSGYVPQQLDRRFGSVWCCRPGPALTDKDVVKGFGHPSTSNAVWGVPHPPTELGHTQIAPV